MNRPRCPQRLGLTVADAEREVRVIEAAHEPLPDDEAIYREWPGSWCSTPSRECRCMTLGSRPPCSCTASAAILTLNVTDFGRYGWDHGSASEWRVETVVVRVAPGAVLLVSSANPIMRLPQPRIFLQASLRLDNNSTVTRLWWSEICCCCRRKVCNFEQICGF